jgi:2-polyprenyl-3-methyl-5-hydroxy-6-metoxy-1,4-benzoquinol methylase
MECKICGQEGAIKKFPFSHYSVYSCVNCGFRWLYPQPSDAELAGIYSDQYFLDEGDVKITEKVNKLKRATANAYLEQLVKENPPSQAQLNLLEIGCGMGDFLLEAQLRGFKVSGLEVTDHLVQFANRRLGTDSVQKGFLETSKYEAGTFDVIAFFDVIEHVRDPFVFMKQVNCLLKKSGKVFIVTPSLDSWSAKLLGNHWMEYKVEHLSYFNKKAMTLLLGKSGFHNIRFHSNYKVLNYDYINRHFVRFPVKGISPVLKMIRNLIPDKLAYKPVKMVASGMAIIADKQENP